MNYKTHVAGGILAGVSTVAMASTITGIDMSKPESIAIYMGASIIGSLFPDLDHRGSYISKKLKITSALFSNLFSHRGATHSPLIMLPFIALIYLVASLFITSSYLIWGMMAFYIGILSHILLDWLTKAGVPIAFPISKKKHSLLRLPSGGIMETIVFLSCVGTTSYLLAKTFLF